MKERIFNAIMPKFNEEWVARVLNMKRNTGRGVDVFDNNKIIEVKFRLRTFNDIKGWTILEHQLDYYSGNRFWGLGIYELKLPVRKIESTRELEQFVKKRELYIVVWEWMNRYNPGNSRYKYRYLSPKFRDLPKTKEIYKVDKGYIYLTEGINKNEFDITAF